MKILGIETSCDETAASVYDTARDIPDRVLSSVLFSQIDLHKFFGGVVPEIASRSHLEKIAPIVQEALEKASISLESLDAIAVTNKPGLPGSLLVGVCFAKAIAWTTGKKIIGVNHLEGHLFSPFLEQTIPFPHLCLTASGGHTSLWYITGFGEFTLIGQTINDAAGEAFDKIAKLLNLPYPGGPVIERLAAQLNFQDFFHYPRSKTADLNFSFSGLKTAVLYDLIDKNAYDLDKKQFLKNDDLLFKQQVASSLLVCVADIFIQKLKLAHSQYPQATALTFAGGVACNKYLREQLEVFSKQHKLPFFAPSPRYCSDNGAMIAFVGAYKAQQGKFDDIQLDIG